MRTLVFTLLLAIGGIGCAQEPESDNQSIPTAEGHFATSTSPAVMRIGQPTEAVDLDQSSVEVRVKATEISENEAFIVVVFEQMESGMEQLDSFAFSGSPQEGDVHEFHIAAPASWASHDAVLQFQLVSADPGHKLVATKVEILDAKLYKP